MSSLKVSRGADRKITSVSTRCNPSDFKKLFVGCLICLGIAGLFHALPDADHSYRTLKIEVGLFGFGVGGILLGAGKMIWRRDQLVADQDGLVLPRCGKIAWSEVVELCIASGLIGWVLRAELKNPDALRRKVLKESAAFPFGTIATAQTVDVTALKAALDELKAAASDS